MRGEHYHYANHPYESWQREVDSNHRMPGSKPGALGQLGDPPKFFGREGGIRTRVPTCVDSRLAGERHRPLGHFSKYLRLRVPVPPNL